MTVPGPIPRAPAQDDLPTRRALDSLSVIINSLVISGALYLIRPGVWGLRASPTIFLPGEDGADGERGPQGLAGVAGLDGQRGIAGEEGYPGDDGLPGLAGAVGAVGQMGPPGLAGEEGMDGERGAPGVAGTSAAGNTEFGGRLTLTPATPVTTSDVTAATTVYYALYTHDQIAITTDGSAFTSTTFTELSLALDSNSGHTGYQQSGKNFDLFVYSDAGTLRLVSGPAWTNDTTRATALVRVKGVLVNSGSMTAKFDTSASTKTVSDSQGTYVGTMRASANGQCEDSVTHRFSWNMYNRVLRALIANPGYVDDNAFTSYSTTSTTWTEANAGTGSKCDFILGLALDAVDYMVFTSGYNSNASNFLRVGVGEDSTTAAAVASTVQIPSANATNFCGAARSTNFGVGYHYLDLLICTNANTNNYYADAARLGGASDSILTAIKGLMAA